MQPPLILIEHPSLIKVYFDPVLTPSFTSRCEVVKWDTFLPDKTALNAAELIVAIAVPMPPQAIGLFNWLRDHPIPTPTLAVLPSEVDAETLETVSKLADDFTLWPIHKEELRHRLERLLDDKSHIDELESARDRLTDLMGMGQLIGRHATFTHAIESIPLIAKSDLPVLITGATGTGKELCARAIHLLGRRRNFPFIAIDCAAIPDHLFENEMFGHARGAFTDAHSNQKGLAAMAEGGTLLLDEVDALSPGAQAKLLRFLQERTYRPLGGDRFIKADIHIVAATNRNIESCVGEKRFRADLYFRLNGLRLELPSLARRRSDIPLLARHFLLILSSSTDSVRRISPSALRKLEAYDWPGNVRELFNVVQRAALFAEGQQILPIHISLPVPEAPDGASTDDFRRARVRAIESFERQYVEELLRKHKGNVTRAALEAGKDRRAFGRLKKKYGMTF